LLLQAVKILLYLFRVSRSTKDFQWIVPQYFDPMRCVCGMLGRRAALAFGDGLNDRILTTSFPSGTEPRNLVINLLDCHNM
jgi:hypothetical protein